MTARLTRSRVLRHAALPLGFVIAPAVIGKARAAAMKMRLSSSQANDPKYANGRVYYENLIKHVKANGLSDAVDVQYEPLPVVVDPKSPVGAIHREPNRYVARPAVLSDIYERFLNNPHQFAGDRGR